MLRHEAAQLLGFANAAEESLATKMAASPAKVIDFLNDLIARAKPVAERELIGTFVSKLNQCHYCYSVHNSAAKAYGYDPVLVTRLVEDIGGAPVAEKMKPLLRYVRKLTLDQSRMVQADADAVYAAGWSEDDLHIAIAITALFNFMNRFVHGLGIEEDPAYTLAAGARLKAHGYLGSSRLRREERDRGVAAE